MEDLARSFIEYTLQNQIYSLETGAPKIEGAYSIQVLKGVLHLVLEEECYLLLISQDWSEMLNKN